jgi:hypothetical protein
MGRAAIGLVAGSVMLVVGSAAVGCGSPSPSESASPTTAPTSATGAGGASPGTTSCVVGPDTEIVDPAEAAPDPGDGDPGDTGDTSESSTTAPTTTVAPDQGPAGSAPAPPCPTGATLATPTTPPPSDPTGSNPAPRLQALTAYLTAHYADTPWRSQLADYKLSTADDMFQLSIAARSTLPSDQAVMVCTAASHWSTTTFADGTITVTDHDGAPLASTPSARNTPCTAAS